MMTVDQSISRRSHCHFSEFGMKSSGIITNSRRLASKRYLQTFHCRFLENASLTSLVAKFSFCLPRESQLGETACIQLTDQLPEPMSFEINTTAKTAISPG
jgi:hypothetical protein